MMNPNQLAIHNETRMATATLLRLGIPALWLAWMLYWLLAALNVKTTAGREPTRSRASHRLPLLAGALLLTLPRFPAALTARRYSERPFISALATLVVAVGLGFSVWARWHLGRNWSGRVTVKVDHALVRTGPYRLVRHPIYTGLLLALIGTAIHLGAWRAFLALPLFVLAFVRKIGIEEERMRKTFPDYEEYRHQTAALIPFVY